MTEYRVPLPARSGPAAADVNPDYLVTGLCASLRDWRPDQFTRFLGWLDAGRDGEPPVPLRLDHRTHLFTSRGGEPANVGECLKFRSVPATADGFPGGLLVLGVLYPDFAPGILGGMRQGEWLAMSVRGAEHAYPGRSDGDLWLGEVSLVSRVGDQLDADALLLGHGPGAVTVWELLSGEAVAL